MTKLFLSVVHMSVTGGVTVLVVLLARLCLKRAPKVFSYALWALVLLRLICPAALASPASVWNLLKTPAETPVQVQQVLTAAPEVTAAPVQPTQWGGDTAYAPVEVPEARAVTPVEVLAWVWLAGALALLGCSLWKLLRLRRKLVGAVLLEGNVYLADGIGSPFVMGLFRPRIYLPFALGARERDYILRHERCHIRHGDHAVKLLAFLALCLHWFNPLVWLAFVLAGEDMEMRCDEAVLRQLGEDIRADYSASLLSLATGRRVIAGTPLAFGEGDPKRRIKNVLNYKKPAFWIVVAAVVAVAVLALVLLTDPVDRQEDAAPETTPPPVQTEGIVSDAPMLWFDAARQEDGPWVTAMRSPHWPWPLYRDAGDTRIYALEDGVERTVMEGMPIQNAWLLDLTGDGAPEVCATVRWGSGIVDEHIVVYDYVEDETYTLWERGLYDYTLEEKDGRLTVVQWSYPAGNDRVADWPLAGLDDLRPSMQVDGPCTPPTLTARGMAMPDSFDVTAGRFGYAWSEAQADGTVGCTTADCDHPLNLRDSVPRLLVQPSPLSSVFPLDVALTFSGRSPDSITVQRWSTDDYGNADAAGTPVTVERSYWGEDAVVFRATEEPGVYVVEAVWDPDGQSWGRCIYAFEVRCAWLEDAPTAP